MTLWWADLSIRKAGIKKISISTDLGYGMNAMIDPDTGELVGFWLEDANKVIGKFHPESAEMIARILIPRL